jgi:hypothetical protein
MLDSNKKIIIPGEILLEALTEVEFILISLHKMGSHYQDKPTKEYYRATTHFIDDEKITQRLAKIRHILSEGFDTSLGVDDMDDIERRMQNINFWKPRVDS